MSKVKITQEQAETIERWSDKEQLIIAKIVGLLEHGKDEPIYTLTTKELIQALYIGYEVEPEFQVGDWVKYDTGSSIIYGQIDTTAFDDIIGNFSNGHRRRFHKSNVILMTPSEIAEEKERRWWGKHGREVWELHEDDLLNSQNGGQVYTVEYVKSKTNRVIFKDAPGKDFEEVKRRYKVVCFAENRLDVKNK